MKLVITYCTQLKLMNFIFFLKTPHKLIPKKKYIQRASLTISTNVIKFVFHMNLDYLLSE